MNRIFVAGAAAVLLVAGSSYGFVRARFDTQAFVQTDVRDASRLAFLNIEGGQFNGFSGQMNIDYIAPSWKADYARLVSKLANGKRVRLGKNAWSRLETDIEATIGGAKLAPGEYYLCAQKGEGDAWSLIALDAGEIRKKHLDAFQSEETTGGVVIPLTAQKSEDEVDELGMRFESNAQEKTYALVVEFGPYSFTAAVVPAL